MLAALLLAAVFFPAPVEHDFVVRDFHFASGETLPEVRIHYATIGTKRPGNAVLILHGTGGSLAQFLNDRFASVLFRKGGVLDAERYFIIIPDNIGHGASSKPSDGLHREFPHYDYNDMVELQHRLITDGLGIDHLFLVMGTSMGAMNTWMWGERYPDMMRGLVPLASVPAPIAGRNRVWRKMMIDDLERGDVEAAVQLLMIVGSAPLQWQKEAPTRDAADAWLAEQVKSRMAKTKADDLLYALQSSWSYDPSPRLEQITAPLLAINSADDFINPPELGIMDSAIKRVKRGRYVVIPTSDQTHGHSTHTWAAVWEKELSGFTNLDMNLVARSVRLNGTEYPYAVYLPPNRAGRSPIILFLHGSGERGTDGLKPTLAGIGPAIRANPGRVPAIVVFPQAPPDSRFIGEPADAAMKALDDAIAEFHGDPDRVYLTGLSMGGYGAWHLALAHPDRWAAIVPICSGLLQHETTTAVRKSPLIPDDVDPYAFVAHALRAKPIWMFHGSADGVIPVAESRQLVEALRREGNSVKYTEYPGVGHNAWDPAYAEAELWTWLFAQRK